MAVPPVVKTLFSLVNFLNDESDSTLFEAHFGDDQGVACPCHLQGTDFGALSESCVSITPLMLDLTAYQVMQTMQAWNWPGNSENAPFFLARVGTENAV
jgi:hypothetical protein